MKLKLRLTIFLLFVFQINTKAQITFQKTFSSGNNSKDIGYDVHQTNDGGYIIAGSTYNYNIGYDDVYLVKIDAYGDTLWTRTFGGFYKDKAYSVQQTSDSGYIIAGVTNNFGNGGDDVYLIRTNKNGVELWSKAYGGTSDDEANSVVQTSDGGFIITGETQSFGLSSYDIYIIKTKANGDTLWTRTLGSDGKDYGGSIRQTFDGGYIVAGYFFNGGFFLAKLNSSGDTTWTKSFITGGSAAVLNKAYSVEQTIDSGYIVAGNSNFKKNDDIVLFKTDKNGNPQWTKVYVGNNKDLAYSLTLTSDGGYIIGGESESFMGNSYVTYLIKTNSVGDTLWTRVFLGPTGSAVRRVDDGGYVFIGATYVNSLFDAFLIKTDANGNSGCNLGYATAVVYDTTMTVLYPALTFSSGGGAIACNTVTKSGSLLSTICASPAVKFFGNPTTLCNGQSVAFTDSSSNSPISWNWSFPGGTPSSSTIKNPVIVYNTPGIYSVTLVDSNTGGKSLPLTRINYITVNAIPATPTISKAGAVLTSSATSGNQWYLNGSIISGAIAQTHTATVSGNYTVVVTVAGCSSLPSSASNITLGINSNLSLSSGWQIYPNPAGSKLQINRYQSLAKIEPGTFTIYDLLGKKLISGILEEQNTTINISDLTTGFYLIRVSNEVQRFEKQ